MTSTKCPNCGEKVHYPEANFCEYCGMEFWPIGTVGLPKVIGEYVKSGSGQMMLNGANYFRWDIQKKTIFNSGYVPDAKPNKTDMPDTMTFVRKGNQWERYA